MSTDKTTRAARRARPRPQQAPARDPHAGCGGSYVIEPDGERRLVERTRDRATRDRTDNATGD